MTIFSNVLKCQCGKFYIPQRWLGVILAMFTIIVQYGMRVSTHLAIVRMVKNTSKAVSKSNCRPPKSIGGKSTSFGEHDWNQRVQGLILSGFYIGYLPLHFPAGAISDKYGSRWILSTGVIVCVVCTFLIPISVDFIGYMAIILLRVIQGASQGVLFPAISAFLSSWIPKDERSLAMALGNSGTPIGSIVGILFTGVLMVYFDTWRAPFYFWGGCGLIVYIFLLFYLYSDPATHPNLTPIEVTYLSERMPAKVKKKIPYLKILLDGAVIATVLGQIGHVVILYFFANNMPKYMDNVLRYPVTNNALISSLPYLAMVFVSIISGKLSDWGIQKKKWDIGCTRKVLSFISNAGPGFFVLGVGYAGCDSKMVILMFVMAMVTMGPWHASMRTVTLDITTQYAGFATALSNGLGSIVGSVCPSLIAFMAPNNTLAEWQVVFWVLCIVCTITTIMFVFMASGKRRRWDYPLEDQKYFVGKVPLFTLWDGVDKDKEAIAAGRAAESSETSPQDEAQGKK